MAVTRRVVDSRAYVFDVGSMQWVAWDGDSGSGIATTVDQGSAGAEAWLVEIVGGSSAGTEYTEDAAAAANPVGGAVILVRDDALSGQTSDDGDNVAARGTDKGEVYVKHVDSIPVTGPLTDTELRATPVAVSVSGVATAAKQDTGNTALAAIQTSVEILDDWDESDRAKVNIIAGQVGVAGGSGTVSALTQRVVLATDVALPAGTNAIGKLAANSGVDIGDVDVTSLVPGVAATNLGKAEDAVHGSGDVGVMALAVRADSAAATGADGDYVPLLTDANGKLYVNPGTVTVASHAVTNAGTFAVQDSEKVADDAAFTVGTTKVAPVGYLADETATDSVDEGDVGAARMTLDRKQHVVMEYESSSMRTAGVAQTPKFAAISCSSSGNNEIVAAVTSKKIRVLNYVLVASAAVNAKWRSASNDKSGLLYMAANTGASSGFSPVGHFETVAGEALNLNLSGATAVGGHVAYIEVP